jgi:hypothetical protein
MALELALQLPLRLALKTLLGAVPSCVLLYVGDAVVAHAMLSWYWCCAILHVLCCRCCTWACVGGVVSHA